MANHSAVRVMLGVSDLERLLREAYENLGEYETRTGVRDANWERWYAEFIITRLAAQNVSDEPFDPGSTSNLSTESGEILPAATNQQVPPQIPILVDVRRK
jgi:hypothetical protein